ASARRGRCGESGLTLMAVALFHGSMPRSRAAATLAPAKFGMRPCGGNGKRATPSAPSLSQTHCRAALLSAKSRAITEVEQHVLVTVKDAICLMKTLGKSLVRPAASSRQGFSSRAAFAASSPVFIYLRADPA